MRHAETLSRKASGVEFDADRPLARGALQRREAGRIDAESVYFGW